MRSTDMYILRGKIVISFAITLLIFSVGFKIAPTMSTNNYEINYEYINIKDMATATVATKVNNSTIIQDLFKPVETKGIVTETKLPELKNTVATLEVPKRIWYLPTEVGTVTQNPHYGHVALDITSYRGTSENIFPVANGVISGIYTDSAGALIVTVAHNINGQNYTSQYVHLSSYAPGLYVGKPVTINDVLGKMGTTGRSTGVHLHLAVLDCKLFDSNDPYCSDLNGFFSYGRQILSQGYIGLGTMMNVPGSWNSR